LSLEDKQTEVDPEVNQNLNIETEIKKVENILKNISLEIPSDNKGESMIVRLAQEFVSLKEEYEILEQKLTKQSSECKEIEELRNLLQTDCENMQGKIESMTAEMQHAVNLPFQLKASEERISSLEKEIESLQDETRALQQSNLDMCTELKSIKSTNQENIDIDLTKSEVELERKLMSSEMINHNKLLQENLDENSRLNFTIDVLKSQLKESSEIMDIIENIKLEIECANNQIDQLSLNCELNNVNSEDTDINVNRMNKTKDIVLILTDLNKKISNQIVRQNDFDTKCQKLIADAEEKLQEIILNENSTSVNKTIKCTEEYVSKLENENEFLKDTVLQIDYLKNENVKSKEQIEKYYEQQKLQDAEINAQKELTIRYQTEIEQLRLIKDENQHLKLELDKLLVEKCDTAVNTDQLMLENTSPDESLPNKEHSQLLDKLSQKSKEIESLTITVEKETESSLLARETIINLSQLIKSKDNEITEINSSYGTLKNERDELIKLVQDKHNESMQYHSEIQRLTQLIHEQTTNLQKIIAEKDANSATLEEKESQLLWTQNELQVVKQRLQNIEETNNYEERCGIAEHTLLSNQVSTFAEKNKIMESALLQDQTNIRYLQEQLNEFENKETVAQKEVERLRNHLVEIEKTHMEEALQSEEIHKTLEWKLMQVEEKLKNSSTIYTSASIRANQQVETLQQQLSLIIQQRDDLQNKISSADDKVLSYSASLTNLQLVLEQFQRGALKFL
jgi:hypothetical protein